MNTSEQSNTERANLLKMLNDLNIEYQIYDDPEYIMENALELGAVETICIRNELDIAFDKNGKSVGNYTNNSGSWRKR